MLLSILAGAVLGASISTGTVVTAALVPTAGSVVGAIAGGAAGAVAHITRDEE